MYALIAVMLNSFSFLWSIFDDLTGVGNVLRPGQILRDGDTEALVQWGFAGLKLRGERDRFLRPCDR